MRQVLAGAFLAFLTAFPVGAADEGFGIHVESTTPDPVGRQLAFEIREGVRRSAGMRFASAPSDAFIGVSIVTLDPDSDGLSTVYSVVLTSKDGGAERPHFDYENNLVGVCGRDRVKNCASSIVASIDELSETYKRVVAELLRRLEEDQATKENAAN
jgi:hypothetical protein